MRYNPNTGIARGRADCAFLDPKGQLTPSAELKFLGASALFGMLVNDGPSDADRMEALFNRCTDDLIQPSRENIGLALSMVSEEEKAEADRIASSMAEVADEERERFAPDSSLLTPFQQREEQYFLIQRKKELLLEPDVDDPRVIKLALLLDFRARVFEKRVGTLTYGQLIDDEIIFNFNLRAGAAVLNTDRIDLLAEEQDR